MSRSFRRGSPGVFPESAKKAEQQDFAQLERLSQPTGLDTTVDVPCGTLTFVKGVLTDKGACP